LNIFIGVLQIEVHIFIVTQNTVMKTDKITLVDNYNTNTLIPEDKIQKAANKLNQIITEYGLTISVQKTRSIEFKGRDPIRTKIVIDKIMEKENLSKYL